MRITLCGSAKFEDRFHEWNKKLTLAGHVVYGLGAYPTREGGKDWMTEEEKTILDHVHMAKIDNSDAIVVLNEDGYYGESTKREIRWARMKDKKVFWTLAHPYMRLPDAWAGILLRWNEIY